METFCLIVLLFGSPRKKQGCLEIFSASKTRIAKLEKNFHTLKKFSIRRRVRGEPSQKNDPFSSVHTAIYLCRLYYTTILKCRPFFRSKKSPSAIGKKVFRLKELALRKKRSNRRAEEGFKIIIFFLLQLPFFDDGIDDVEPPPN